MVAEILRAVNQWLAEQDLLVGQSAIVNPALIDAPSLKRNKVGATEREMLQKKKGNQWFFGMKAHIGVDTHSWLVRIVAGAAANLSDLS